jgi:hypothetical protein
VTAPHALLVVDDNESDREIVALTLSAVFPKADILRVGDPREVKALCEQTDFDCVLLDYNMPEIDGVTLGRELRAASAYLPLVLMTNVGDEMLAAEALRSGLSDYLPKSRITADSMRRTIDRSIYICGQDRMIDEQRAEIENFAYALAHDFKQPIRQIATFTQMITMELADSDGGAIHQHPAFLGEAARRLGRLVDVMSQYTLLNQPPDLSAVDLDRVVEGLGASLGPYLVDRRAKLDAHVGLAVVHGNETLLTQVLQNLILNGLTYNRSRTPRVKVTTRRNGEAWIIDVADNGIGMQPEYLTDIFKPLVRLHTAADYPGTGLGLTLARKAVLAQKGAIWCDSTPGRGSTFHVRLPAATPAVV